MVGAQTWTIVTLNALLWKWTNIILSFLRLYSSSVIEVININCTVLIGRISHFHIWRQDHAKCPEQGRNHSWPFWSLLLVPDIPITSPIFSYFLSCLSIFHSYYWFFLKNMTSYLRKWILIWENYILIILLPSFQFKIINVTKRTTNNNKF